MCPDLRLSEGFEQKLASDPTVDIRTVVRLIQDGAAALKKQPSGLYTKSGAERAVLGDGNATEVGAAGAGTMSDAKLAQLALSALMQNTLAPTGKVHTVVRNAWLILEGEVEGPVQRRAAAEAVKGLPGIRGISNNILIESEVMAQRVSRKIDETFVRNAELSAHRISVTASDHKIILCGSVRSHVEREQAEAAAWAVPGVALVINRIRVTD